MRYEIWCDGKKVASFEYEDDRDLCLDALRGMHPDAEFIAKEAKP